MKRIYSLLAAATILFMVWFADVLIKFGAML